MSPGAEEHSQFRGGLISQQENLSIVKNIEINSNSSLLFSELLILGE